MRIVFLADKTSGNPKPIDLKDIGTAEGDFHWTFGLTPEDAAARATELNRAKHIDFPCDVDEVVLPQLCTIRAAGV